jgi:hypothetical protein
VVCRTDASGKRTRKSKTFPLKADLIVWMNKAKESGPSPAGTVGEWLTQWLELHKSWVEPKSYETDRWAVGRYLSGMSDVKLRELTPHRIETHVRGLPCSANEQHKAARTLRNALNAAVVAGLIPESPMAGKRVRMPKRKVKEVVP